MQKIKVEGDPQALRAKIYPDIGEQLDAILMGFVAIQNQEPLPAETVSWIQNCQAVKDRFPKKS